LKSEEQEKSNFKYLRFYSCDPCFDIIPAMGRLRIKKKEVVLPFRQTMAYRLLLALGSLLILFLTTYFLMKYYQSGNNVGMIASVAGVVMAVTSLFYNLGEVRNAKIPSSTLKRARRR